MDLNVLLNQLSKNGPADGELLHELGMLVERASLEVLVTILEKTRKNLRGFVAAEMILQSYRGEEILRYLYESDQLERLQKIVASRINLRTTILGIVFNGNFEDAEMSELEKAVFGDQEIV